MILVSNSLAINWRILVNHGKPTFPVKSSYVDPQDHNLITRMSVDSIPVLVAQILILHGVPHHIHYSLIYSLVKSEFRLEKKINKTE